MCYYHRYYLSDLTCEYRTVALFAALSLKELFNKSYKVFVIHRRTIRCKYTIQLFLLTVVNKLQADTKSERLLFSIFVPQCGHLKYSLVLNCLILKKIRQYTEIPIPANCVQGKGPGFTPINTTVLIPVAMRSKA